MKVSWEFLCFNSWPSFILSTSLFLSGQMFLCRDSWTCDILCNSFHSGKTEKLCYIVRVLSGFCSKLHLKLLQSIIVVNVYVSPIFVELLYSHFLIVFCLWGTISNEIHQRFWLGEFYCKFAASLLLVTLHFKKCNVVFIVLCFVFMIIHS